MNTSNPLLAAGLTAALLPAQGPADAPQPTWLTPIVSAETADGQALPDAAPGGRSLPSLRTPIHTAPDDLGFAYGTWAAGDDYKVSFHDGMTFVPYLGGSYPTTQKLRWRTTSAKVGEVELVTGAPVHEHTDYRYEYRFGPITEAYDVLAEGLEQTFVVSQRPAVGDLVIRGAVESLLRSRNAPAAHQALTFVDADGHAIVEYGRAIAYDGNGRSIDVTTEHADGVVTLTVPGDWIAAAAMPIVVDPLLARVTVSTWTGGFGEVEGVDIARDDSATSLNVMFAFARRASATDSDLWLRLTNDNMSGAALVFSDITTNWDTDQPSCCFVGGVVRFAAAFRRFFPTATPTTSQIRCKLHDSGSATLTTNVGFLIPASGINHWRPDIGGVESFATGNNAYVVFQQEDNGAGNGFSNTNLSKVYGVLLDANTASGTFLPPVELSPGIFTDSERPSITKNAAGGTAFSWVCVFQRIASSSTALPWDVIGKKIAQNGTIASGSFLSDYSGTPLTHQLGPVVEGNNGRYAVAFAAVDQASVPFATTLITGKQVVVERFDWPQTASAPTGNYAPVLLRNFSDRRWEVTGIGYDTNTGSHWTVGYRSIPPLGDGGLFFQRCGYDGGVTEGHTTLYFVSGQLPVGGNVVFDNDNNNFLFGYGVNNAAASLPVFGHAVTYLPAAPPSNFGFGSACSSATLGWNGSQQIGAQFGSIGLSSAPSTAIHFLILSLGTVNVPVINPAVFPGCRLLVAAAGPDYLGYFPPQIGSAPVFPLPLPSFLGSQTLYFQDWYLNGPFLYSTERLSVPIIK
jgi:hypothetical protein